MHLPKTLNPLHLPEEPPLLCHHARLPLDLSLVKVFYVCSVSAPHHHSRNLIPSVPMATPLSSFLLGFIHQPPATLNSPPALEGITERIVYYANSTWTCPTLFNNKEFPLENSTWGIPTTVWKFDSYGKVFCVIPRSGTGKTIGQFLYLFLTEMPPGTVYSASLLRWAEA